ncbi:unnamed protein product [Brassica oleracea var. botrytis]
MEANRLIQSCMSSFPVINSFVKCFVFNEELHALVMHPCRSFMCSRGSCRASDLFNHFADAH